MVVDTMRAGATGKDRWQAKSLRSTFGNQCVSQLPTSPSCGFGSAVREATDKVRHDTALRMRSRCELSSVQHKLLCEHCQLQQRACTSDYWPSAVLPVQTYVSPDVDRANCRSRGGNNSQGAIYKVQVSCVSSLQAILSACMLVCCLAM